MRCWRNGAGIPHCGSHLHTVHLLSIVTGSRVAMDIREDRWQPAIGVTRLENRNRFLRWPFGDTAVTGGGVVFVRR